MPFKSHLTQIMQNYLDSTDRRSRENSTSLEAQILNMAANRIEDLDLRITRELAQSFQEVPANIDNFGTYYAGRVPDSFITGPDQDSFSSVIGMSGIVTRTLTKYDDRLPVPSRVELDSSKIVPVSDPVLFTMIGSGDDRSQSFTVQYVSPGQLPIPNTVTFWLDNLGLNTASVTLTISGETHPRPAWVSERRTTTEIVVINSQGASVTRNRWHTIDKVSVRGLPIGARLRAWGIGFTLPASLDSERPYSTPDDRDILFQRYWQISNPEGLLRELYMAGGLTGLEMINSYKFTGSLSSVCVEPNTYGMYAASSDTLYYIDRREVYPDLSDTGLIQEPLFGLQVSPDISKTGTIRYVILSGIPYANANNIYQYRYVINDINSVLPDGSLGPLSAGWRGGTPKPVSIPLVNSGDYQFRLECQDVSGNTTSDVVPYLNAVFTSLKSIDLSSMIDGIAGLSFDSYGTLWIWNGAFAIPMIIHYDGYVVDPTNRTIYTTDLYDSLQVS